MASDSENVTKIIKINIPDKIIEFDETTLKTSTMQKMISALKSAYYKIVEEIEAQISALKNGATEQDIKNINTAYDEATQALGQVYNRQLDEIYAYYQRTTGKQSSNNQNDNNGSGNNSGTPAQTPLNSSQQNRLYELRNTPGYQNYVVDTAKTIDGVVGSSVYKKYYSDISAELYFNGHWFEDINSVQWQIQRQTYPLFGYNSFIYDDVALGNRIIYGMFTINFTEPNRLKDVIDQTKYAKVEAMADTDVASYEKVSQTVHTTKIEVNGQTTKLETNDAHATIWSPRFDIDVVFGESDVLTSTVILPKHIILWDCHLMGSQIGMATNDGVLQETYQFLARDFKVIK